MTVVSFSTQNDLCWRWNVFVAQRDPASAESVDPGNAGLDVDLGTAQMNLCCTVLAATREPFGHRIPKLDIDNPVLGGVYFHPTAKSSLLNDLILDE
jgi:hypothetical protein